MLIIIGIIIKDNNGSKSTNIKQPSSIDIILNLATDESCDCPSNELIQL